MAAPAKTIHTFKPADLEAPRLREAARAPEQQYDDRRRMNVSEKLAEGRGFWRGAFVGASVGIAGGIVASGGIASMWTDEVLKAVQTSNVMAQSFGATDDLRTIHQDAPQPEAPSPAGGLGGAAR